MSENERAERCETCRFWFQDEREEGQCRRYPPQMVYQKWTNVNDWLTLPVRPQMDHSDWCGEWQSIGPDLRHVGTKDAPS